MACILSNILGICNSQFKCNYLKNEKIFLAFLFQFWNLNQILNIWNRKMIVLANVFSKLQTVKKFVTPLCKKRRFGTRLDSRHVKMFRIFAKSPCFYHVFLWICGKYIWKIPPCGLGGISVVFVDTFTADGNCPVIYCGNLQLSIQMHLSEKPKTFSPCFVPFLQPMSNSKQFFKKRSWSYLMCFRN